MVARVAERSAIEQGKSVASVEYLDDVDMGSYGVERPATQTTSSDLVKWVWYIHQSPLPVDSLHRLQWIEAGGNPFLEEKADDLPSARLDLLGWNDREWSAPLHLHGHSELVVIGNSNTVETGPLHRRN